MFAAFQRATKSTEEYLRASARSWVVSPDSSLASADDKAGKRSAIHQIDFQTDDDPPWIEIPLSDEDEQPSPRGVLQFRKTSESDGGLSQAGDLMPYPSGTSLRRRRNSSSSTYSSDQSSPLPVVSLPYYNLSSGPERDTQQGGEVAAATEIFQGQRNVLERRTTYSNLQSTPSGSIEGDLQMEGFTLTKESSTSQNSSMLSSRSQNAGTQTPKDGDEFASTRTALQHQLADALNALDLTRKQADALRDRLRTYTSSMKQQADDLRASSRSLSHALDKAKEYKVHWKNESKLKEEAKRKVDELDSNVKSLQKTLNQRESEMRMFHQGIDTLNILLGVDTNKSTEPTDKLNFTSKAIKQLLELVEKLQTEAAVSSIVSMVELKESLRKFEEEKQSWISFTKANERSVSNKISTLQNENEMLQAKLDKVQQSSVEIRNRLTQAESDRANKNAELDRSQRLITTLQATLRATEEKLVKSVESLKAEALEKSDIRAAFTQKQLALQKEKNAVADSYTKLTKLLENKKFNVRDQMTAYEPPTYSEIENRNVAVQTSQQDIQPSNSVSENEKPEADIANSLRKEIADLKWSLWNMKRDFSEREDDYFRMHSDFRQLRWTCHYQEVTVQTVRAENKALKTSIAKLKQAKDDHESDTTQESQSGGVSDSQQLERSDSWNGSQSERVPLRTISENSNEKCCSPGEIVSITSIGDDNTDTNESPNVFSPTTSFVSADLKRDTSESRTLTSISSNNEPIVHNAAISLSNEHHETTYTESENSQQSSVRKRGRKSRKHRFPIWRQENPDNQFSSERIIEDCSSTDSDDIFMHRGLQPPRTRRSTPSQSSKSSNYTHSVPCANSQSTRQLGIPMSEHEFGKLVRSMTSASFSPRHDAIRDVSLYDDGYSSSVVDALESRPRSQQFNRTLLGYDIGSISSENDEPRQTEPRNETLEPCLVSYGGLTFDATKFGLVEMRQFMCDLGIAHSANEMHKFIDFLAEKVHELDNDPVWRGSHNLGKSEDWLSLKCLF